MYSVCLFYVDLVVVKNMNGKNHFGGTPPRYVKHAHTSEVMWQLMVLFSSGIARMAIYTVLQSHSQQV